LRPQFAELALEAYEAEPPAAQSALKAPVAEAELDAIDQKRFQKNGKHWWWLYSGPVPPKPKADEATEKVKRPKVSALEKLGSVLFLIYWPPEEGEEIAEESVLSWSFGPERIEEFKPGEWILEDKDTSPKAIKLVNIEAGPGGTYVIVYDVYADAEDDPVSRGRLTWGGDAPQDDDVLDRVRITPKHPPVAEEGMASEEAAIGGTAGRTAPVVGTTTPEPLPVARKADEVKATVEWENRSRATVTFDRKTRDYFKGKDAKSVMKTVKTQVAKDASGRTLGLQITGLGKDSPAQKFDVRKGDILVSIDGKPVESRSDAVNIIQGMDKNITRVTVVIDRNGRKITYIIDPQDTQTQRSARYLDEK